MATAIKTPSNYRGKQSRNFLFDFIGLTLLASLGASNVQAAEKSDGQRQLRDRQNKSVLPGLTTTTTGSPLLSVSPEPSQATDTAIAQAVIDVPLGSGNPPQWIMSATRSGHASYSFQVGGGGSIPLNLVGLSGVPCQVDVVNPGNLSRAIVCQGYQWMKIPDNAPHRNGSAEHLQPKQLLLSTVIAQVIPGRGDYPAATASVFVDDVIEIARPASGQKVSFFASLPWNAWAGGKFKPWQRTIQVWNGSTNKLLKQVPYPESPPEGPPTNARTYFVSWTLTDVIPDTPTGIAVGDLIRVRVITQGQCQTSQGDQTCGSGISIGFHSWEAQ